MPDDKTFTETEAYRHFAVKFHGQTWDLLEKKDRSAADSERMVHLAHASCCHWLVSGTPVNHQRGEWLIAQAYCALGYAEASLRHAKRCDELTRQYTELMQDFDFAFNAECLSRAYAIAGDDETPKSHYRRAEALGAAIVETEEREYFLGYLATIQIEWKSGEN